MRYAYLLGELVRKRPLQTKWAVTHLPKLSLVPRQSILSPVTASKIWGGNGTDLLLLWGGGSPREEGEDGGLRDLKERGRMGRNMHGGYPFPKIQVRKNLSLCWAGMMAPISAPRPPPLFPNLRTSQHFRRELLPLPGVPAYLVWGDEEAGCEAGRSQDGMGSIYITLSKDRKVDSMLKSETSPDWRYTLRQKIHPAIFQLPESWT